MLAIAGLTTSFRVAGRWQPVVRDVSLEISPGETLAIVGESGSGKSVTALSIMRLVPELHGRIEGSVRLDGVELLALSEPQMRRVRGNRVAMVFQEPMTSLNPVLTVGFQIAESLVLHRGLDRTQARAEALRLLDKVRVPAARSRFDDHPHRFSGGMRQRVMIAMALACRPRLLIADEPTTALDVTIQAQIIELVKSLQREDGTPVLWITHDMAVVAEIADRMAVMREGRVVETGTTAALFARPAHPYTRALLTAVPSLGSMRGRPRPMRFPVVDPATGVADEPGEPPDSVARGEPPLLSVRGLAVRYDIRGGLLGGVTGRVHAVEDVSFDLRAGETLALVGESGCGKTTTGRAILRLVEPTAGSVSLAGTDVLGLRREALRTLRRRMQMIFQDPYASLNPRIDVGSAIAQPLVTHGLATAAQARERVATLLERVGLSPDMASRLPHEFSGGQRQRISIARALALEPALIVADEAVSALDVSIKAQVINLMLELQQRLGLAYLFISHDMAVVERIAHRVAVMHLGEIVEIGPREAVLGDARHPYTRRLLAAVPRPDPSRRGQRRPVPDDEVASPIRAVGWVRPRRRTVEVSPGHAVQAWGDEWEGPGTAGP